MLNNVSIYIYSTLVLASILYEIWNMKVKNNIETMTEKVELIELLK